MFGRSRAIPFDPYGSRRGRARVPRWLVLLIVGVVVGAVGVVVAQERYLPPRLSASASAELQAAFAKADAERTTLRAERDEAARRLAIALDERKNAGDALAASQGEVEQLRGDVASAVAGLPPDPRGGSVEVRAARFTSKAGGLVYDVVLTRERAGAKPIAGVMQLVVTGDGAGTNAGAEKSITLKPVALSIGAHQVLRGTLPLPDNFRPHQTTVQVLDRAGGRSLGMRVLPVK